MNGKSFAATRVARIVGFPEPVTHLIDIAHVLVAEAEQEPPSQRAAELAAMRMKLGGEQAYADQFAHTVTSLDDNWTDTWSAAALSQIAVDHPWFALEDLAGGALHRRIDAVYDEFETPFCAHEVQARHLEILEALVDASESGGNKALKFAANLGLGAAGGVATVHGAVNAMSWANRAATWISGQGRRSTNLTLDLAKIVLAWSLLPEGEDGPSDVESGVAERCRQEFQALLSTPAPDEAHLRMWRWTLQMVGSTAEQGEPMPNLVGKNLARARQFAQDHGLEVSELDVGRPPGAARTAFIESNWTVVAQYPLAGTPTEAPIAAVGVVKNGESDCYGDVTGHVQQHFTEIMGSQDRASTSLFDIPS